MASLAQFVDSLETAPSLRRTYGVDVLACVGFVCCCALVWQFAEVLKSYQASFNGASKVLTKLNIGLSTDRETTQAALQLHCTAPHDSLHDSGLHGSPCRRSLCVLIFPL